MNILFFLTPKADVQYVYDTDTLRQALEKMDHHSYASVPIISEQTGEYLGTLTEGDLLRAIKSGYDLSLHAAEDVPIMNVARRRDYLPVDANCDIEDIVQAATTQNFVPVVDDSRAFIGLITRKEVIRYLCDSLEKSRGAETASAVKTSLSQVSSDPTDDPLGGRIHENVGEFKAIF